MTVTSELPDLAKAIVSFDLPEFIKDQYPESKLRSIGRDRFQGRAVWRGDYKPSFALRRHREKGKWIFSDFGMANPKTGKQLSGDAFDFFVQVMEYDNAQAAAYLLFGEIGKPFPKAQAGEPRPTNYDKPGVFKTKYVYKDVLGEVQYEILRYEPKSFRPRRFYEGRSVWGLEAGVYHESAKGDWVTRNTSGQSHYFPAAPRLIYKLPEVLKQQGRIFVVDGEKDVNNLWKAGYAATCCNNGMAAWTDAQRHYLAGKVVTIVADNESQGHVKAEYVASFLSAEAQVTGVLYLPSDYKDVSDVLKHKNIETLASLLG